MTPPTKIETFKLFFAKVQTSSGLKSLSTSGSIDFLKLWVNLDSKIWAVWRQQLLSSAAEQTHTNHEIVGLYPVTNAIHVLQACIITSL